MRLWGSHSEAVNEGWKAFEREEREGERAEEGGSGEREQGESV